MIGQLKEVVPSVTHVTQKCNSFCFHSTDPILACGVDNEVILLFGKNSSIPFSNWKEQPHQEKEHKLQVGEGEYIIRMKWNVSNLFRYLNEFNNRYIDYLIDFNCLMY